MPANQIFPILLIALLSPAEYLSYPPAGNLPPQNNTLFEHVADIPLPAGYTRVAQPAGSFGSWLRLITLKGDKTVYLFDGRPKPNQSAQHAVLDVPVGTRDLQQCADAVMRLRAEYLLHDGRHAEIAFYDNAGKKYQCPPDPTKEGFERYLEKVYSFCGTLSLARQLKPVPGLHNVRSGDVLIQGGSPGHAVIVVDVAENARGEKIFMLAQSYMPAQSVHILKNPSVPGLSPWYKADSNTDIIHTPEWDFKTTHLMRW